MQRAFYTKFHANQNMNASQKLKNKTRLDTIEDMKGSAIKIVNSASGLEFQAKR